MGKLAEALKGPDVKVDFPDLVTVAQHYDDISGNATWRTGDFNYDGKVTFADLVVVAQNYDKVLPADAIPGAPATFEQDLARAFALVPEPGAASLLFAAGLLCDRRRRRRHRRPD